MACVYVQGIWAYFNLDLFTTEDTEDTEKSLLNLLNERYTQNHSYTVNNILYSSVTSVSSVVKDFFEITEKSKSTGFYQALSGNTVGWARFLCPTLLCFCALKMWIRVRGAIPRVGTKPVPTLPGKIMRTELSVHDK